MHFPQDITVVDINSIKQSFTNYENDSGVPNKVLKENKNFMYQPCILTLLNNKINKPTKKVENCAKIEKSEPIECYEPKELFNIDVVYIDKKFQIMEHPEKFIKLVKLMFEKTFRDIHKIKEISFTDETEETRVSDKRLISRELIRGLRSFFHKEPLKRREYYFEPNNTKNAKTSNWFESNLSSLLSKFEMNQKAIQEYIKLLDPLTPFLQFDQKEYLREINFEKEKLSTSELFEKIEERKKEIQFISTSYVESIQIGI
jgi:hypothetical protein